MAKNIGTLEIISENATLLSENFCNFKCFGISHVLIVFVCTGTTHTKKKTEEKSNLRKFHTELKNGLDKIIGT